MGIADCSVCSAPRIDYLSNLSQSPRCEIYFVLAEGEEFCMVLGGSDLTLLPQKSAEVSMAF